MCACVRACMCVSVCVVFACVWKSEGDKIFWLHVEYVRNGEKLKLATLAVEVATESLFFILELINYSQLGIKVTILVFGHE